MRIRRVKNPEACWVVGNWLYDIRWIDMYSNRWSFVGCRLKIIGDES